MILHGMRLKLLVVLLVLTNSCTTQKKSSPDAVNISPPTTTSTIINADDSSYLMIKLSEAGYNIRLLNDSLYTTDSAQVDKFIAHHLSLIDKEKILVHRANTDNHNRFSCMKQILKKHELFKFKLIVKPEWKMNYQKTVSSPFH